MLARVDAPGQTADAADRALTDYDYDAAGRVSRVTGPAVDAAGDRPVVDTTYTPAGLVATTSETSGVTGQNRVRRFAFNAHGEAIRTEGPRAAGGFTQRTDQAYTSFGEVRSTQRWLDATRHVDAQTIYDHAGNATSVSQPTGTGATLTSLYRYDSLNRLVEQTQDPMNPGHTVAYTYEGEGAQLTRVDKVGGVARRTIASAYNRRRPPSGPAVSISVRVVRDSELRPNHPGAAKGPSTQPLGSERDANSLGARGGNRG